MRRGKKNSRSAFDRKLSSEDLNNNTQGKVVKPQYQSYI